MNPTETKFERILADMLTKAYQKKAQDVADGVPAEKYREEVGYLRGLKDALGLMGKARSELNKDR